VGGSFADEVATLTADAGLNAFIRSLGLGNGASLTDLDRVDDGTANGSAVRVLTPSTLTAGLTGAAVQTSAISSVDISLNGVPVTSLSPADLTSTPFGLTTTFNLTGLAANADDVVLVQARATDGTVISTQQIIEDLAASPGTVTDPGGTTSLTVSAAAAASDFILV
jgi:hypothetical protein